jgi:hypothetical protein
MLYSKWVGTALAVTALTLSACSDDDDNGTGPAADQARVRVVHASPDAPAVDVRVDDAVALSHVPIRAAIARDNQGGGAPFTVALLTDRE